MSRQQSIGHCRAQRQALYAYDLNSASKTSSSEQNSVKSTSLKEEAWLCSDGEVSRWHSHRTEGGPSRVEGQNITIEDAPLVIRQC